MRQPLAGIRVLDVGTRIAAPFCAGILGEQGAEVIKVEDPGHGDMLRDLGPYAPGRGGRYVCIVAAGQTNFERLCRAMDRPELAADERYATSEVRGRNNAEINGVVAEWAAGLDAAEIESRCVACDVPVGTVYDAADLAADEHVAARGDICTVDDPVIGPVRQQAPFPRLSADPPTAPTGAPRLGEHTEEILSGLLGLSSAELDALRADNVI